MSQQKGRKREWRCQKCRSGDFALAVCALSFAALQHFANVAVRTPGFPCMERSISRSTIRSHQLINTCELRDWWIGPDDLHMLNHVFTSTSAVGPQCQLLTSIYPQRQLHPFSSRASSFTISVLCLQPCLQIHPHGSLLPQESFHSVKLILQT